jgi:hypothetical protein
MADSFAFEKSDKIRRHFVLIERCSARLKQ